MKSPLEGVRVLDLTRALAGPLCTALLGDMGAQIIKVETLPHGDLSRQWGPFEDGESLYHRSINRNKRSIALDPRSAEGRTILRELVASADVLIENFRPGVLERMGLGPEQLRREQPDLIISSISGFGPVGPYKDRGGFDQVAQSMSGLMSLIGDEDTAPMRVGVPISDALTGLTTAFGIAACLAGRVKAGAGGYLQSSLIESTLGVLTFQAQRYLSSGEVPGPQGNQHGSIAPYGVFHTGDGPMSIAAASTRHWQDLCSLVERPDLVEDPRFRKPDTRHANRHALADELNEALSARTAAEWTTIFSDAGIPCGPIYTIDQVFEDPHIQALEVAQPVRTPAGDQMTVMRGPLWLDGEPTAVTSAPPDLGADTDEILRDLGYTPDRIGDLHERNVVGGAAVLPART